MRYLKVTSFLLSDLSALKAKQTTPPPPLPAHFPAEPIEATHGAVVLAQLLLAPEAHVQAVARHVQVLGAEAGAAAEAPRSRRGPHGEVPRADPPASVGALPDTPPAEAVWNQGPRVRSKFPSAEKNEDSAPENGLRCWKMLPAGLGLAASAGSTRLSRSASEFLHPRGGN